MSFFKFKKIASNAKYMATAPQVNFIDEFALLLPFSPPNLDHSKTFRYKLHAYVSAIDDALIEMS